MVKETIEVNGVFVPYELVEIRIKEETAAPKRKKPLWKKIRNAGLITFASLIVMGIIGNFLPNPDGKTAAPAQTVTAPVDEVYNITKVDGQDYTAIDADGKILLFNISSVNGDIYGAGQQIKLDKDNMIQTKW